MNISTEILQNEGQAKARLNLRLYAQIPILYGIQKVNQDITLM